MNEMAENGTGTPDANRAFAIAQLKARKSNNHVREISGDIQHPPAQHRDASRHSNKPITPAQFFSNFTPKNAPPATSATPRRPAVVLVPDSSPIAEPSTTRTKLSGPTTSWKTNSMFPNDNILSGSSGFQSSSKIQNKRNADSTPADIPRKRPNLGTPERSSATPPLGSNATSLTPISLLLDQDSSPELNLPRRAVNHTVPDDDTIGRSSISPQAPRRIMRGSRLNTAASADADASSEVLDRLYKLYSDLSPDLIKLVFEEEGGHLYMNNVTNRLTEAKRSLSSNNALHTPSQHPRQVAALHGVDSKARGKASMVHAQRRPPVRAKRRAVDSGDDEPDFSADDLDDDSSVEEEEAGGLDEEALAQALKTFNEASSDVLQEITGCTPTQATIIISMRPFETILDLRTKLSRKKGVSVKIYEAYLNVIGSFGHVDGLLSTCEEIGLELAKVLKSWTTQDPITVTSTPTNELAALGLDEEDAGLHITELPAMMSTTLDVTTPNDTESRLFPQPASLASDVILKDYQLVGLNWLNLLWSRRLSCILADEMGLGKTVQVISFLAHLNEQGLSGPHLVVVPSSTLENWLREFARFSPSLTAWSYYGSQMERADIRAEIITTYRKTGKYPFDVLVTTYNLAQGSVPDRKFLCKTEWLACIFDEGHVLKNYQSQRYEQLMKIESQWRLLLTGTPLQNNLQELCSLMNFILPHLFKDAAESLRAIFKVKADSQAGFLSRSRISRAKKIMTPFVLRRRKDQVLKDLPKKTERVEWCELTDSQRVLYKDTMRRSRKALATMSEEERKAEEMAAKGKTKNRGKRGGVMSADTSSHVLMDLRKAALHPLLFRLRFDDKKIRLMAKQCMKEPEFMDSKYDLIVEDMEVMTDAELQLFCKRYKSVHKNALPNDVFLDSSKVAVMLRLLQECKAEDKRVLVFSQFVQVLDILQRVLTQQRIRYLVLTGQTPVDERQGLVDQFTEETDITVFLLSTRAGGMGINLTAASVVIIFDQDFNPHNDKQACDRAYRIGQKRDVEVIKLVAKSTIEEDMLRLGETKLALDDAVAADAEDAEETAPEKAMKASLMSVLRKQFEKEEAEENTKGVAAKSTAIELTDEEENTKVDPEVIEISDGEDKPVGTEVKAQPGDIEMATGDEVDR